MNNVFDCTTVQEAQGAVWVTGPGEALGGGEKLLSPHLSFHPIPLPHRVDR